MVKSYLSAGFRDKRAPKLYFCFFAKLGEDIKADPSRDDKIIKIVNCESRTHRLVEHFISDRKCQALDCNNCIARILHLPIGSIEVLIEVLPSPNFIFSSQTVRERKVETWGKIQPPSTSFTQCRSHYSAICCR